MQNDTTFISDENWHQRFQIKQTLSANGFMKIYLAIDRELNDWPVIIRDFYPAFYTDEQERTKSVKNMLEQVKFLASLKLINEDSMKALSYLLARSNDLLAMFATPTSNSTAMNLLTPEIISLLKPIIGSTELYNLANNRIQEIVAIINELISMLFMSAVAIKFDYVATKNNHYNILYFIKQESLEAFFKGNSTNRFSEEEVVLLSTNLLKQINKLSARPDLRAMYKAFSLYVESQENALKACRTSQNVTKQVDTVAEVFTPPAQLEEAEVDLSEWIHDIAIEYKNNLPYPAGTILLDRYQIDKRIGGGGSSNVYLAYDKANNDQRVAIRQAIVFPSYEKNRLEKAINEWKRMVKVKNDFMAPLYNLFILKSPYNETSDTSVCTVSEYIEGDSFNEILVRPEKNLNVKYKNEVELTVVKWAIDICDALDCLHSQRPPIIYAQYNPCPLEAFIIDNKSKRIKLIGLPNQLNKHLVIGSKSVFTLGEMGYTPPERFSSAKVDPRYDIYAFGALLFHLLTEEDPRNNPMVIFDFARCPKPRKINPAISPEMEAIICKALEYKPVNRFSSALEMKKVLTNLLAKLESQNT